MTSIENIRLWTALITPMLNDGSVDYPSLKKLLDEQNEAKNGILILGSTGESLNISGKERKEVIRFACENKKDSPLMAGIGGSELEATLEWVDFLNTQNLDCYLSVTPLYAKPGDEGQFLWFENILNKAAKPCVLYNVPGRTATSLSLPAVKRLGTHENFFGIKEASGSPERFSEYVAAAPGKKMYCGDDGLMPEFAERGAWGLISVASNPWPRATAAYTEKAVKSELSENEKLLWKNAANSLFEASNPVPAKKLMAELGSISSPELRLPLSSKDLENTNKQRQANEKIKQWFSKISEQ